MIFFIRFSKFGLVIQTWEPQVKHFMRKSIPARITSKVLPPHGWGFFNSNISPTLIFTAISVTRLYEYL
jgi:hypothetical protein